MADGEEIEGFVIGRQTDEFRNGGVVEGSDRDCAEAEGGGLEENVLGDMTGFDVHVANGPVAVLDRRACEDGSYDEDGRCVADRFLADGATEQPETDIVFAHDLEVVTLGPVVEDTVSGEQIHLSGVGGARRRCGPIPRRGNSLRGPEQLGDLAVGEWRTGELTYRPAGRQSLGEAHAVTGRSREINARSR